MTTPSQPPPVTQGASERADLFPWAYDDEYNTIFDNTGDEVMLRDGYSARQMQAICQAVNATASPAPATPGEVQAPQQASERLANVRAAIQANIDGCCRHRAGIEFCEMFGCGTMLDLLKIIDGPVAALAAPAAAEDVLRRVLKAVEVILPALPNGTYCQCQGEHDCQYCAAKKLLRAALQRG